VPQTGADEFESVDFFTKMSIIDDPYPYYRWLRESRGPVWIEHNYGVAIVIGHDEAMELYRSPEYFSSCNASSAFPQIPVDRDVDDAYALIGEHRVRMPLYGYMVTWDAPEHDAYPSLLTGLFTPKRLKENEDFVWRADHQLGEFITNGTCEFISEFSSPSPPILLALNIHHWPHRICNTRL
jgi:cytochrome P450